MKGGKLHGYKPPARTFVQRNFGEWKREAYTFGFGKGLLECPEGQKPIGPQRTGQKQKRLNLVRRANGLRDLNWLGADIAYALHVGSHDAPRRHGAERHPVGMRETKGETPGVRRCHDFWTAVEIKTKIELGRIAADSLCKHRAG